MAEEIETTKTVEEKEQAVAAKPKANTKKRVVGVVKNCNLLNVRATPSLRAEVLDKISKGTNVRILGEESNFYKVYVNSKEGYCVKDYIEVTVDGKQG